MSDRRHCQETSDASNRSHATIKRAGVSSATEEGENNYEELVRDIKGDSNEMRNRR